MKKTELIAAVAEKSDVFKKEAEKIINATFDVIREALAKGDKVTLVGFGSFEVRERAEREGRNPHTGEKMKIAGYRTPGFKPGKALKDAVNQ